MRRRSVLTVPLAALAFLLAGCAGADSAQAPSEPTPTDPGLPAEQPPSPPVRKEVETSTACRDVTIGFSAGAQGAVGQTVDVDLGGKPDGFFAGLAELRMEPGVSGQVERLQADLHDEAAEIASTSAPGGDGVYRLALDDGQWTEGNLSVRLQGADGAVLADKAVGVCFTAFLFGPGPAGFSAFGEE